MDKRPFFSIATPCWNSVATIERTIKSVLDQDFKDYEYIIVDGGSTDGTLEIIKKYEPLFEGRMKWRSEPDKGLYDAFNKGVERSIGIYCWNVNSDDYLAENVLTQIYDFVQRSQFLKLPILSFALNYFDEQTGKIIRKEFKDEEQSAQCVRKGLIGVVHPATLVPKLVYDMHGAFDSHYKIMGDCDWFFRMIKKGERFVFENIIVTNMSNMGVSSQWSWKRYKINYNDRRYFYNKTYNSNIAKKYHLACWNFLYIKAFLKEIMKNI